MNNNKNTENIPTFSLWNDYSQMRCYRLDILCKVFFLNFNYAFREEMPLSAVINYS